MEPPQRPDAESRVLAALCAAAPAPHAPEGPGDDAAVRPGGEVVTVDTLVEGVHFDQRLSPADVGWKAVAVSVSDAAAMGAQPGWIALALSLPEPLDEHWLAAFAEGLGDACRRWQIQLIGGDTTRSPGPRFVSVTLGGQCVGAPMTRAGGRPGDTLWVTGTLGRAGAGWALPEPDDDALAALRRPDPPLAFALDLARRGLATAAMDVSDGLAADLPRLCAASRCGARVGPIPTDRGELGWTGGDDYELLFAAAPGQDHAVRTLAARHGRIVTPIGALAEGPCTRLDGAWPTPRFAHWGLA